MVDYIEQYRIIHENQQNYGPGPGDGEVNRIRECLKGLVPKHPKVVDFGCGNSRLAFQLFPDAHAIFRYDPAITGLHNNVLFGIRFFHWCDIGICTDVMEHIPLDHIHDVLDKMHHMSRIWYFTIHTAPAAQILPNGENAHCTQQPKEWWIKHLRGRLVWEHGVRFGMVAEWERLDLP